MCVYLPVSSRERIEEIAIEFEVLLNSGSEISKCRSRIGVFSSLVRNGGACRVLEPYPTLPPNPNTTTTTRTRWNELCGRQAASSLIRSGPSKETTPSSVSVVTQKSQKEDDIYSTLRALQSRNRHPKKWLGQHYMINEKVNTDMIEAAGIQPGDLILEIGPGTGSLTKALVEAGAHIIAVEKDADMAALVGERFLHTGQVEVVRQDFLKWSVSASMSRALEEKFGGINPPRRAKVIANLPFNITTQVVKKLLPLGSTFSHIILLLQDEAALRLVDASPEADSHEYRPISLFINFYSVPEYLFKVGRECFFPQPRVDAGVISFALKQEREYPPVASSKNFFTLVNSAFTGKRKMLRKSLQHLYTSEETQAALSSVGLLETSRPEELTLDQFVALHNALVQQKEAEDISQNSLL